MNAKLAKKVRRQVNKIADAKIQIANEYVANVISAIIKMPFTKRLKIALLLLVRLQPKLTIGGK